MHIINYHNTVNLRAVPRFVPEGRSVVLEGIRSPSMAKKASAERRMLFYDQVDVRMSVSICLARRSRRLISLSLVGCKVVTHVSCPAFVPLSPRM